MQERDFPIQIHLASVPCPEKHPPSRLCQPCPTWFHITCIQDESPGPLQAHFHLPARAQALLSAEHSQVHKQLSACDTTSSLWEQITQCVCPNWGSCSVSAHSRTEPGSSDAQVGWCCGICAQIVALLHSAMFHSPLQMSLCP